LQLHGDWGADHYTLHLTTVMTPDRSLGAGETCLENQGCKAGKANIDLQAQRLPLHKSYFFFF